MKTAILTGGAGFVLGAALGFVGWRFMPPDILTAPEAAGLMSERVRTGYKSGEIRSGDDQLALVRPLYISMDDRSDRPVDRFAMAEAAFLNFKPDAAYELFSGYLDRNDLFGRLAWQRVMQMDFAAYDRPATVEQKMAEFRRRFPPSPLDIWGLYQQTTNFARMHAAAGDHERVVDVILAEVDGLPLDAPYRSFSLPGQFIESFREAGREAEAHAALARASQGLSADAVADAAERAWAALPARALPPSYLSAQGIEPGEGLAAARVRQHQALVTRIGNVPGQATEAPSSQEQPGRSARDS